jgi:hypothetical protein
MFNAEYLTAIATCFIAAATIANVWVYWLISRKIEVQIILAKEQTELTRKLFLESHAPALSVSIKKCEYSEADGRFKGRILTTNHGTAVADNVNLRISFGGSNVIKDIGRIAIQPKNKIAHTFSLPMTADRHKTGQTDGNRFNVLVEGSYKGLADHEYSYRERQEYDPDLKRFVPIVAW